MQTSWLTIVLFIFAASRIQGQVSPSGPLASAGQATNQAQDTPYVVVECGANQRVWEQLTYETLPSGQVVTNVHRYTEMASGLNHWQNGQWVESKEEIDILPNGTAAATNGQHRAYFPGDIYNGAIRLMTSDGKQLQSRPLGLSYDDGTNTVLIAELTNSVGYLVGSNQVIYPDAFTDFKADLRYTYTKAGFEQDIILQEQPLTPGSYGLNPATTRLQVLTEFFNPPQPAVTTTVLPEQAGITLTDANLDFGVMKMMPGRAFLLGSDAHEGGVLVSKSWVQLEGRQFLVEEVPVEALVDELAQLPVSQAASIKPNVNSTLHVVSAKRLLPAPRLVKTSPGGQFRQMAQAAIPARGLVLDYQTISGNLTNYTFQGDTTYYLSSTVNLFGTNTFEGGAVLKYATNVALNLSSSPQNWLATAYRPVVFTAKDDNSAGQSISGSTGNPTNYYYANPALSISSAGSQTISNFRIACAQQAISLSSDDPMSFYHGQLVHCQGGLTINNGNASLRNMLFSKVQTNFNIISCATNDVQNATFSGSAYLMTIGNSGNAGLVVTNCILANVTNLYDGTPTIFTGGYNGFYNTQPFGAATNGSPTYPFQTVGAGNYYLATGCVFTNAGVTNIDPILLAALQQKTTCPPILLSNVIFSVNTNLFPQAQRDTNAAPNLGYHYDPLDYLINGTGLTVSNGVSLTLTNGVAVGGLSCVDIFPLNPSASFISQGTANAMNRVVWFQTVQEQPVAVQRLGSIFTFAYNAYPSIQLIFTDFPGLGNSQPFFASSVGVGCFSQLTFNNCWLRGMLLSVGSEQRSFSCSQLSTVTLQNNLLERSSVSLFNGFLVVPPPTSGTYENPLALNMYNNLFWHGTLTLTYQASGDNCHLSWAINDNLFDTTTNSLGGNGPYTNYISRSNNGFYGITNSLGGTNNLTITNLTYATSWLGPWYIGTSSPTLLYAGSRNAASAGLYHYTIQTNQVPDGTNMVSIGFHYVATDTNGIPLDSNGDGLPDYREDANGNGLVDNGETPWMAPPTITIEPTNQAVIQNSNATFSVTAIGVALSYQWYFNSAVLSNQTNTTLTLNNIQTNNAGNYSVVVTNVAGSVISSNALLMIIVPPSAISGLNLWLRADMGVTNTASQISAWADQSGNGNDAVQSDNKSQPLLITNVVNGLPAVRFDGTNDQLMMATSPGTNNFTVFAVVRTSQGQENDEEGDVEGGYSGQHFLFGGIYNHNNYGEVGVSLGTNGASVYEYAYNEYNDNLFESLAVYSGNVSSGFSILTVLYTNQQPSIYLNGDLAWVGLPAPREQWVMSRAIGNGTGSYNGQEPFGGNVTEILVFNRSLPGDELWTVAMYLNYKYGVMSSVPDAPVNLTASSVSTNQVSLTWVNTATNANRFQIERKLGAEGTYQQNGTVDGTTTSYFDTGLAMGTQYYYRVRASNLTGSSDYSNATNAMTLNSGADMPLGELALWLKADAGMTQGGMTAPISFWADQSGNGNDAGQSNLVNRPMWAPEVAGDRPVVRFDGESDFFNLPGFMGGLTQAEAFVVLKVGAWSPGNSQGFWHMGNSDYGDLVTYPGADGSINDDFGSTNLLGLGIPAQPITQFHVYNVSAQNESWAAWINCYSLYQTNVNEFDFNGSCYLGASGPAGGGPSSYFLGDMAEVLVFNRALTADERMAVNGYLNGKYRLPPIVLITSPTNNLVVAAPADISINTTVVAPFGINQVEFFQAATSLGIVTNAPYSLAWNNVSSGIYALTARATENNELTSTSSVVYVLVDNDPYQTDTDIDGVNDMQEYLDGTDPLDPASVTHKRLGYWTFDDTNTWVGEEGQLPLVANNVVGVSSWNTNAVFIDSTNPAILTYRDVETNGNANISLRQGTIRFWFKPDWSSANQWGTGPGCAGRLIEVGNYNPAFTNGWWALCLSPDGTQLTFGSSTNGAGNANLSAYVSWALKRWHQIVLTYSPTNSTLYWDGLEIAADGTGTNYFPSLTERANGFRIGSDASGGNQAGGVFEDLETFNYQLSATDIADDYDYATNSMPVPPTVTITNLTYGNTYFVGTNQALAIQVDAEAASGLSIQEVDYSYKTEFTVGQ